MKFCTLCGSEIQEGAKFCVYCGKKIEISPAAPVPLPECQQTDGQINAVPSQPAPAAQTPSADMQGAYPQDGVPADRNRAINLMAGISAYFTAKAGLYAEYERLDGELAKYEQGTKKALLVFGILFCVFFGTPLFGLTLEGVFRRPAYFHDLRYYSAAAFLGFQVAVGIIFIVTNAVRIRKNKQTRTVLTNRFCTVAHELTSYASGYAGLPLPAEYTNPSVLAVIANYVRAGRAYDPAQASYLMMNDLSLRDRRMYNRCMNERRRRAARCKNGEISFIDPSCLFGLIP